MFQRDECVSRASSGGVKALLHAVLRCAMLCMLLRIISIMLRCAVHAAQVDVEGWEPWVLKSAGKLIPNFVVSCGTAGYCSTVHMPACKIACLAACRRKAAAWVGAAAQPECAQLQGT